MHRLPSVPGGQKVNLFSPDPNPPHPRFFALQKVSVSMAPPIFGYESRRGFVETFTQPKRRRSPVRSFTRPDPKFALAKPSSVLPAQSHHALRVNLWRAGPSDRCNPSAWRAAFLALRFPGRLQNQFPPRSGTRRHRAGDIPRSFSGIVRPRLSGGGWSHDVQGIP